MPFGMVKSCVLLFVLFVSFVSGAGLAEALPDLVVTKIEVIPTSPAAGKPFKIKVTVSNKLADRAGSSFSVCAFEMYAYADGTKIGSECDSFGLAGKSSDVYTINVPGTAVPTSGKKKIKVVVDATSKVKEFDESNNSLELDVTFTAQGPDLVVTRIWTYPAPPYANESATIYATIQNNGSDPVSAPFNVRFYISGATAGNATITSLASGAQRTVSIKTTQTTATTKTVRVVVDNDNKIPELNENNNSTSKSIKWEERLADLIVSGIVISPTKPVAGGSVKITATIKNQGFATAGGITNSPKVRFYVDGKQVGSDQALSFGLGAGNSNDESVSVTVNTSGAHKVKVTVDPDGKIKETDDTNNSLEKSFTWLDKLPDLDAFDLSVNPGSPIVGSPATFTVSIKNIGTQDVSGTVSVDFYVDNQKIGVKTFNGLSINRVAYVSYAYSVTSAAGPHVVKAVVNPAKTPAELGYTTNTIQKTFTWGTVPKPDLTVTSITAVPASPVVGTSVTITATIKNKGSKGVPVGVPSFYVRFFVDGKQIDQKSKFIAFSAGATDTFQVKIILNAPGVHKIKVIVDPTDKVVESDETNNEREVSVTWKDLNKPDLLITSIFTVPSTVTANKRILIYARVTNAGKASAPQSIKVRFWVDGQVLTPDYDLTTGLTINQVRLPSVPFTPTKDGSFLVKVTIDPDKKVAESDETNNDKEFKLVVVKATEDKDGDGVPADKDCDDNDKNIYPAYNNKPAATEVCNGKDDNCDGQIDEGFDKDNDGYATCGATPDCDDNDKAIHPGASELCNGKDDNCDGNVDENLTRACKTACGDGKEVCQGGNWTKCDAPEPKKEECNGIDDDCNGVPDDGSLCQNGQICKAGSCVEKPPCDPACKAEETCVNSQCVPKDPCAGVSCKANEECQSGQCTPKKDIPEPQVVEVPPTDGGVETAPDNGGQEKASGPDNSATEKASGPDNAATEKVSNPDNAGKETSGSDNGKPAGGCSCSAGAGEQSAALFLFLGLFLLFSMRLRRRARQG